MGPCKALDHVYKAALGKVLRGQLSTWGGAGRDRGKPASTECRRAEALKGHPGVLGDCGCWREWEGQHAEGVTCVSRRLAVLRGIGKALTAGLGKEGRLRRLAFS